jgi:hypothetical protein
MIHEKRELQNALERLAKAKKTWQLEYSDPDAFWLAYKGAAQVIFDGASPSHQAWVQKRIWVLLEGHS